MEEGIETYMINPVDFNVFSYNFRKRVGVEEKGRITFGLMEFDPEYNPKNKNPETYNLGFARVTIFNEPSNKAFVTPVHKPENPGELKSSLISALESIGKTPLELKSIKP